MLSQVDPSLAGELLPCFRPMAYFVVGAFCTGVRHSEQGQGNSTTGACFSSSSTEVTGLPIGLTRFESSGTTTCGHCK